jgi:hypothetical protein
VRRLEGAELFPIVDARGVHRFSPDEVAAVARRLRAGKETAARGSWIGGPGAATAPRRGRHENEAECRARELNELRGENAVLRAQISRLAELCDELDLPEAFLE